MFGLKDHAWSASLLEVNGQQQIVGQVSVEHGLFFPTVKAGRLCQHSLQSGLVEGIIGRSIPPLEAVRVGGDPIAVPHKIICVRSLGDALTTIPYLQWRLSCRLAMIVAHKP